MDMYCLRVPTGEDAQPQLDHRSAELDAIDQSVTVHIPRLEELRDRREGGGQLPTQPLL